ncbi:MAG TPA: lipid-A-disaccharide synthase [Terracidiphilus sp.]|jgi:lipid-A-disaccharide synthase|nr:lipid-A-disaccharide synthase [Terracidiphilus sp.]
MSGPNIFISAGEASGEHYGALLVEALQKRLAAVGQTGRFFGMGGQRMANAGLEVVVRSEDMAVMGITEVVRHLPRIYREFGRLKRAIRARRPDVAVLIDFPDIHFKLAEQLHGLGVPVIFFVSPQLWAWKKHRIRLVQKYIGKMLVIFPFEEQFYREHGVTAEFVGHPLADLPLPTIAREQFAAENALDPAKTWIALLPGSRAKEIRDHLPEILTAARLLAAHRAHGDATQSLEFVVPLAPTLTAPQRRSVSEIVNQLQQDLTIRLVDEAGAALFHARASVVASGTATVEAALIGNPFVVVYRVSPITYAIAQRIVTVPHVAMANLIAGQRVVPELIQNNFTAANIVQELEPLLPDAAPRQSMMKELERIRSLLNVRSHLPGGRSENAIDRVAAITLEQLGLPSPLAESVKS